MPVFITNRKARLTLYAWQEGEEFMMSPHRVVTHGRRPIQRFNSREGLEAAVRNRGNEVKWLE